MTVEKMRAKAAQVNQESMKQFRDARLALFWYLSIVLVNFFNNGNLIFSDAHSFIGGALFITLTLFLVKVFLAVGFYFIAQLWWKRVAKLEEQGRRE